jgi:hypothetical protein
MRLIYQMQVRGVNARPVQLVDAGGGAASRWLRRTRMPRPATSAHTPSRSRKPHWRVKTAAAASPPPPKKLQIRYRYERTDHIPHWERAKATRTKTAPTHCNTWDIASSFSCRLPRQRSRLLRSLGLTAEERTSVQVAIIRPYADRRKRVRLRCVQDWHIIRVYAGLAAWV